MSPISGFLSLLYPEKRRYNLTIKKERMMNIKLVAVDMDGTLLDSKKRLPEDFIPWVKSHPQVKVAIASGRQYYTLERMFHEIAEPSFSFKLVLKPKFKIFPCNCITINV